MRIISRIFLFTYAYKQYQKSTDTDELNLKKQLSNRLLLRLTNSDIKKMSMNFLYTKCTLFYVSCHPCFFSDILQNLIK